MITMTIVVTRMIRTVTASIMNLFLWIFHPNAIFIILYSSWSPLLLWSPLIWMILKFLIIITVVILITSYSNGTQAVHHHHHQPHHHHHHCSYDHLLFKWYSSCTVVEWIPSLCRNSFTSRPTFSTLSSSSSSSSSSLSSSPSSLSLSSSSLSSSSSS